MSGGNDGNAEFVAELLEEADHLLAGFLVEVGSGFVGEDDFRPVGEGSSNGDALLLAAGKFAGLVENAVSEADEFEKFDTALAALFRIGAGKTHGEHDIFKTCHGADQVVTLKNVTDFAAAEPREFVAVELGDIDLVDVNFSTGRLRERANHVEEGGFSRTRRAHDGEVFPPVDFKSRATEGVGLLGASAVDFFHIHGTDDAGWAIAWGTECGELLSGDRHGKSNICAQGGGWHHARGEAGWVDGGQDGGGDPSGNAGGE